MGHTVVGVFRHSGDAHMIAAHLRDAFTLDDDELDVIGEAEFNMGRAEVEPTDAWLLAAFTGIGLNDLGDDDPVMKRWGDQVQRGSTLVVARADDPDRATEIAGEMRRAGAARVDLLPH
ncbi:hypothetical protein J2Z79_000020 [Symbiobacterium terraclitae]|uniref:Uncharacterized protein n=1 Tax=Symbiobacterium terraclitae TaxID=557451 RepID=A0ABS4JM81_9FIRM|nr:hypothetical protein [Symbiobacterium terraclitae]MBP2016647.1 hypothetical protein [Symbiobacterium terraclitae]